MIADQLPVKSIVKSRQAANATQSFVFAWLHGQPMDRTKSQYYEHLRRLRAIGIDISVPFDATRRIPQIKRDGIIQFKEVTAPAWYQMPVRPGHKEVRLSA